MWKQAALFAGLMGVCAFAPAAHATQHFVFGLSANQTCDVYQGSSRIEEGIPSSSEGALVFAATGAGTFQVVATGTFVDTTAPSAVTDLAAGGPTAGSITLNWTSTGDDGTSGQASVYDLRYSTSPINDSNWAGATAVVGEPAPKSPGLGETFTVVGLSSGTQYYFALKVGDEVPNFSALSNIASGTTSPSGGDTTPPAAISNLAVQSSTSSSATLTWTATGDDGSSGKATSYDLRYSTSAITSANFANATPVSGEPAPKTSGQAEVFTVTGLTAGATYYFALKAADEVPNWSAISNVPSETLPNPDVIAPSAVTNLAVTTTTSSGVTLTWTAVGDDNNTGKATTYDLRYSTSPITSTNFTGATQVSNEPAPKTAGQAETFTVTGLQATTTYYFALKVADEVPNWSLISNVPSGTTPAAPDVIAPATVTNLAVGGTTSSSATLTWTATGDDNHTGTATSYDLRYATVPITSSSAWTAATQATGEPLPKANGQSESFVLSGLNAGTTYYFALKVGDEVPNWSGISNSPSGSTPQGSDSVPPSKITDLTVLSATSTSVTLRWTAVGDDGISGNSTRYDMRYEDFAITTDAIYSHASYASGEPAPVPPGQLQTMTVSGLVPNHTYYFCVRAADEVFNWSPISNSPSGATPSAADTQSPSAVNTLTVTTPTLNSLTLHWTATGDDGTSGTASSYDIRYSTSTITTGNWPSATQAQSEPNPKSSGQSETFVLDGLAPGVKYYVAMRVGDEVPNWSGLSNVPSGTTLSAGDVNEPGQITDLAVPERQVDRLRLSWSAPGDDGYSGTAHHYELRRSTNPITSSNWGQSALVSGVPSPGPAGTQQLVWAGGLAPSTRYYFGVKAFDEAGNASVLSNVPSGLTLDAPDDDPPVKINDLTLERAGSDRLDIHWTAPYDTLHTASRVAEYEIKVHTSPIIDGSEGAFGANGPIPAEPGQTERYTVFNLDPGVTYYVRIRSKDDSGNLSKLSNQISGTTDNGPPPPNDTTPPAATTDLHSSEAGPDYVSLAWTAPGDDGMTGSCLSYDVRHATFPITTQTWDVATAVTNEPAPHPAGATEALRIDGLAVGALHYFALRSTDDAGNTSISSNVLQATTPRPDDVASPFAVTDLAVVDSTLNSLSLRWTTPADSVTPWAEGSGEIASYQVRYATELITPESWSTATPVEAPDAGPSGSPAALTIAGLAEATTYHFAVRSSDEHGNESALSNVPNGRTQATPPPPLDLTPPAAVSDLLFSSESPHSGRLTWTATGDDGLDGTATKYLLRRIVAENDALLSDDDLVWEYGDSVPIDLTPKASGASEELPMLGLTAGFSYAFGLLAVDEAGNRGAIVWSSPLTQPFPPDTIDPNAIGDLAVELDFPPDTTGGAPLLARSSHLGRLDPMAEAAVVPPAIVTWSAPADSAPEQQPGPVASYHLRWADASVGDIDWTNPAGDTTFVSTTDPGVASAIVVSGLSWDTQYSFLLVSRDEAGNESPFSNVANVTVPADTTDDVDPPDPDLIAPGRVTTLQAFVHGPQAILIGWIATGDDGEEGTAARHQLRYSFSPIDETNWALADTIPGTTHPQPAGATEQLIWPGLQPNTTYYLAFGSWDEAGNPSPMSNLFSVYVPEQEDTSPPAVPTGVQGLWADERIQLGWLPSPDADVVGYQVYRKRDDEQNPTLLADQLVATHYEDMSTIEGHAYRYSVSARDAAGNLSARSVEVEVAVPVVPIGSPGAPHVNLDIAAFEPIDWKNDRLVLRWRSDGEDDLVGFRVYRQRDDQSERTLLTHSPLLGDGAHEFEESPVPAPGHYQYWIEAFSFTGGTLLFDPLEVEISEWSERFYGAFPNPTSGPVQVVFSLSSAEQASLRLYDATGRQVGAELSYQASAGRNEWRIDLTEGSGVRVGGVYYGRLVAGPLRETLRFLIVRPGR